MLKFFEQLPRRRTSTPRTRWPTSSSATSCSGNRFPGSPTSTRWCGASCRRSRSLTSTSWPATGCPDRNRVVAVSAPKKDGVTVPHRGGARGGHQERRLRGADGVRRYRERDAAPRAAADARRDRADRHARKPSGITEWTLSNGVRVVLKPTDVQAGRDPVSRLQPRRHVARADGDFVAAETADQVVAAGRARQADRHRSRQEAGRQGRVRASGYRRAVRRV